VASGYNVVTDSTCRLAATGDRADTAPGLAPLAAVGPIASGRAPTQRSTFADAIPAGTVGLCDGTTPADLAGQARPGTVAGCTAGALEEVVPTRFDLVVDDPGDAPDATPGDERCATAAGSCTLRAAIDEANADPVPDRIVVTAGVDPVLALAGADDDTNATGDLDVLTPVTIVGAGATLDAAGIDRALDVAVDPAAGEVVVDELHLTGGAAVERGAGLRLRVGTATLRNSHVHHNTATSAAGAAEGGGAAVEATATRLTVEGSTFEGNRAESAAGPARGGGLAAEAAFVVRTSTFVGNAADGPGSAGGALAVPRGRASAHITASTVAGNTAETGAGLAVADGPFGVTASILDNGPDCAVLGSGRFNAFFSLDASGSCGFGAVYNLSNVDPLLGPLGLSGGPTPVRRPLAASPVIELIPVGQFGCTTTDPSTDQLGGPRPLGERCDVGAVEGDPAGSLGLSLIVDTAADGHDADPGDRICATEAGACSLRAAVDETNASRYPDLITIAPGIDPVLSIPRVDALRRQPRGRHPLH
jgi:CSLREA domain-containing protein